MATLRCMNRKHSHHLLSSTFLRLSAVGVTLALAMTGCTHAAASQPPAAATSSRIEKEAPTNANAGSHPAATTQSHRVLAWDPIQIADTGKPPEGVPRAVHPGTAAT